MSHKKAQTCYKRGFADPRDLEKNATWALLFGNLTNLREVTPREDHEIKKGRREMNDDWGDGKPS